MLYKFRFNLWIILFCWSLPCFEKRCRAGGEPFIVAAEAIGAIPQPHAHFQIAVLDNSWDNKGMVTLTFMAFLAYRLPRENHTIYNHNIGRVKSVTWSWVAPWSKVQFFQKGQWDLRHHSTSPNTFWGSFPWQFFGQYWIDHLDLWGLSRLQASYKSLHNLCQQFKTDDICNLIIGCNLEQEASLSK